MTSPPHPPAALRARRTTDEGAPDEAPQSDPALFDAARGGRLDAFGPLIQRHHRAVLAAAFVVLGDAGQADDIAQEAFVTAWTKLDELRDASRLRAWVCGIARNLARNARRRLRPEPLASRHGPASAPAEVEEHTAAREQAALVRAALHGLPSRYRDVLVTYYLEEQSIHEVAESLGLSVAAVEQRLSRGRKRLRGDIERMLAVQLAPKRSREAAACAVLQTLRMQPRAAARTRVTRSLPVAAVVCCALAAATGVAVVAGATASSRAVEAHDPPAPPSASPRVVAAAPPPSMPPAAVPQVPRATPRPRAQLAAPMAEAVPAAAFHIMELPCGRSLVSPPDAHEYRAAITEMYRLAALASELDGNDYECGGTTTADATALRELQGRVVDVHGVPVARAIVIADGAIEANEVFEVDHVAETDERGEFAMPIAADDVMIWALHEGGQRARLVRVPAGDTDVELELRLTAGGTVSGSVHRGKWPEHGTVRVQALDSELAIALATTAGGTFESPTVSAGTYAVEFVRDCVYDCAAVVPTRAVVDVRAGADAQVQLHVDPSRDVDVRPEIRLDHSIYELHADEFRYVYDPDVNRTITMSAVSTDGIDASWELIAPQFTLPEGDYTLCARLADPSAPDAQLEGAPAPDCQSLHLEGAKIYAPVFDLRRRR
ncbi:MAG: sigma-70 family RNA polymerase sigma factor [Deltaproteobacteria bacterium]|nr:sigma-70 family RNA polymerase sigma factor [Deltaproteobacteria bacterium]